MNKFKRNILKNQVSVAKQVARITSMCLKGKRWESQTPNYCKEEKKIINSRYAGTRTPQQAGYELLGKSDAVLARVGRFLRRTTEYYNARAYGSYFVSKAVLLTAVRSEWLKVIRIHAWHSEINHHSSTASYFQPGPKIVDKDLVRARRVSQHDHKVLLHRLNQEALEKQRNENMWRTRGHSNNSNYGSDTLETGLVPFGGFKRGVAATFVGRSSF